METPNDPILEKELNYLLEFIQKNEDEYIQDTQEYIFTVIYLITNLKFRTEIAKLRDKYNIPERWEEAGLDWSKWLYSKKPFPPDLPDNKEIRNICMLCKVNPRALGEFVLSYLYFGDVKPLRPPDAYYINAKDEFRSKCRLEALTIDYSTLPDEDRERGYIRFYKNTTIAGLIKFIEANREEINEIKKGLALYPYVRIKSYKNFKRDIQVYILHLLGNKKAEIQEKLSLGNIPENNTNKNLDKQYGIEDNKVYDIIEDTKERLKTFSR